MRGALSVQLREEPRHAVTAAKPLQSLSPYLPRTIEMGRDFVQTLEICSIGACGARCIFFQTVSVFQRGSPRLEI